MTDANPAIVIVGGPNGAGKTTISRPVLRDTFGITEFVNADAIAVGLSAFSPDRAAFAAGRIMLCRLRELGAAQPPGSFAFETTLASRTFAPWLRDMIANGFAFHLVYVWLRSADLAVRRVGARVKKGGHHVPQDVVRRRYSRSIHNLVNLYMPLATGWRIYDNSDNPPVLVAEQADGVPTIRLPAIFNTIMEQARAANSPKENDY